MSTLQDQLILHEGLKLKPYVDTVGKITIGVGRNLTDDGITRDEALQLLQNDISRVTADLAYHLPWTSQLDPIRLRVLQDMAFNMGIDGLLAFKLTLAAVKAGEWVVAAGAMLNSRWAREVGARADRLSQMMETGQDYG